MVLISSNPLHPLYEQLARGVYAYFAADTTTKGLIAAQLSTLGYTIDKVFDDATTSFQALGLISKDGSRPPVLVSQGTVDEKDSIDDTNPRGVGFNEFSANKAAVNTWLTGTIADKTKNPNSLKVDLTGQSLGGALAQWFASEFPTSIREAVTFQSPGITKAASDTFRNNGGTASQITHYVVNGDIISLGGETFLPGTLRVGDYQTPPVDPEKFFDKHSAGILNESNSLLGFANAVTNELAVSLDDFNKPTFTFTGQDWQDFISKLKQGNLALGTAANSRAGVELQRIQAPNSTLLIGQISQLVSTPTPVTTGISFLNNFFSSDGSIKGLGVKAVSQKSSNKVSEIAAFFVDDANGKIGNLSPGAPGYVKAALDRARPIFSTLGGAFFNNLTQQNVGLDVGKFYQFVQIQDSSVAELKQKFDLNPNFVPTNILFPTSSNSPIKIADNVAKDGYQVSINNDELVLNILKLNNLPISPIGSKSQSLAQGRTIDLTDFIGQTLKVDITTLSDAAYSNNIGFYEVETIGGVEGIIKGTNIKPGDNNYALEAVKKAVSNALLTANKTDTKLDRNISGGVIYAPVAIAKGTLDDFVRAGTNNGDANAIHAYFNYIGANPDKIDHFRLLGANTFGVEDLYNGGDRDFNDIVINLNVKTGIG